MTEELQFCLSALMGKSCFSSEGGSETESTVDSDFGRGDLLTAASSDPFFSYKTRYIVITKLRFLFHAKLALSLFPCIEMCLLERQNSPFFTLALGEVRKDCLV